MRKPFFTIVFSRYLKLELILFGLLLAYSSLAQSKYTSNPKEATFIYSDIDRFWQAFDKIDEKENPFIAYLDEGSDGLKDFIPNRIESPNKLLKVVKRRYPDYESRRQNSSIVESYETQIKEAYQVFSELYEQAVFPPTYYVIGAFNTGGTAATSGLIIGVERQDKIEDIPYIVAHEIIHFNQSYPKIRTDLLAQSITEGSADFIGELISGSHTNKDMYEYATKNEAVLKAEFANIMHEFSYKGWLYGSKGKKKDRPKDLGYWMGYKICQSYYENSTNKEEAIREILTIKNFNSFLAKSGYLKEYLNK